MAQYSYREISFGILLLVFGIMMIFNLFTIWVAAIPIIIEIILLIKDLKQYEYFLINGGDWEFRFRRERISRTLRK